MAEFGMGKKRPLLMRTIYMKKDVFRSFFRETALNFAENIGKDISLLKDKVAPIINKKFVFSLNHKNNEAESFLNWIKDEFYADSVTDEHEGRLRQLVVEYPKIRDYIRIDNNDLIFDSIRFADDVLSGRFKETIFGHNFDLQGIMETAINTGSVALDFSIDPLKKELLLCDYKRANIEPYSDRLLTDVSLGHWDLYEDLSIKNREDSICLRLPTNDFLVARPASIDVVLNGTCAIDFGTRSTVVVCRDRDSRLIRIGKADYKREPLQSDYENPTAIELLDIEKFKQLYRATNGRPKTEWLQVTASHKAAEAIFERQEKEGIAAYYAVFSDLKRWTKSTGNSPILKDSKGYIQEVKPYIETCSIDEGGFDPLEIYAYYLGLYINNMHRQIYIDYILSFPVSFEKNVRERIRASFERGLKKSLPVDILNDKNIMERFRVYDGASEPVAYAISALEAYGLEPQHVGEEVAYGVFDFGGGTTDFDFGVEYIPHKKRRKFVIEQFGCGSDMYLGGENILELLAYEVFKDNITEMRKHKITFALPPESEMFAGAEALVRDTRDAASHMNNKILSEKLRPFWELTDGVEEFNNKDVFNTSITLFSTEKNTDGSNRITFNIHINVKKLEYVLEKRIRIGVDNFFQAMATAFKGREPKIIHIFLAGNSCKSPVVLKLFNEYIDKITPALNNDIKDNSKIDFDKLEKNKHSKVIKIKDVPFKLHLPLGMKKQSVDMSSDIGKATVTSDFDKLRTGKTGVAFGLLRCRRGGKDVKIINKNVDYRNELLFPYFLGSINEKGNFKVEVDIDIDYGIWTYFTYADEEEFELYYSKEPRSKQGHMKANEVKMVRCIIDRNEVSDDENIGIYIKKVTPDTIEYTVASQYNIMSSSYDGKIYTHKLD